MRFIFAIIVLFCFWLSLSGHFTLLFFSLGIGSAFVSVLIWNHFRSVVPFPEMRLVVFKIHPIKIFTYFLWLLGQIILANIQVARIILSPFSKITPHFLAVTASQKSLIGEVIFANSITLTPGTISIATKQNEILVHALTKNNGDIAKLSEMGQRVCELEN